MIVYRKIGWGLHLLLRLYGSAVVRTTFFGALAALETALLYAFLSEERRATIFYAGRPYVTFPAFAGIVAFLVIFRQNFSYGRFHEGRVQLQAMTAAWYNAAALSLSFGCGSAQEAAAAPAAGREDVSADGGAEHPKLNPDAQAFKEDVVHEMSLLHAACLQLLRCDWELDNLSTHDEATVPPWDSAHTPNYSINPFTYLFPIDRMSERLDFYRASPLPVVGGVTEAERANLSAGFISRIHTMRRGGGAEEAPPSAAPRHLWSRLWANQGSEVVRGAAERPYKLYYRALERFRHRMAEGGITVASPVAATLWQSMSAGVMAFEHARYLTDTPFPFPWAQLIIVVLLVWQAVVPLTVVCSYQDQALGITIAVVTVWVLWALNEVAREIEDPFICEPNDLPMARQQYQFNQRLLATARGWEAGGDANGGAAAAAASAAPVGHPGSGAGGRGEAAGSLAYRGGQDVESGNGFRM